LSMCQFKLWRVLLASFSCIQDHCNFCPVIKSEKITQGKSVSGKFLTTIAIFKIYSFGNCYRIIAWYELLEVNFGFTCI
jgi:hypothetical protein